MEGSSPEAVRVVMNRAVAVEASARRSEPAWHPRPILADEPLAIDRNPDPDGGCSSCNPYRVLGAADIGEGAHPGCQDRLEALGGPEVVGSDSIARVAQVASPDAAAGRLRRGDLS